MAAREIDVVIGEAGAIDHRKHGRRKQGGVGRVLRAVLAGATMVLL